MTKSNDKPNAVETPNPAKQSDGKDRPAIMITAAGETNPTGSTEGMQKRLSGTNIGSNISPRKKDKKNHEFTNKLLQDAGVGAALQ